MKALYISTLTFLSKAHFDFKRQNESPTHPLPLTQEERKVELKENFTWQNVDNVNYLTVPRNQHQPYKYCGGCWSFGVAMAISDRIKILRKAAYPDVIIAPQILVSCSFEDNGCDGGSSGSSYKYIQNFGIVDESCSPYQARGHTNGIPCSDEIKCKHCDEKSCWVQENYPVYYVSHYDDLQQFNEEEMRREIQLRGPITCGVDATEEMDINYYGGILKSEHKDNWPSNHIVEIVGFGIENGVKFWQARNSWGTYWGELGGFFRIERGTNAFGIEQQCNYAVPINPDIQPFYNNTKTQLNIKAQSFIPIIQPSKNAAKLTFSNIQHITNPQPDFIKQDQLPQTFSWSNYNGMSYLTYQRNQLIPNFCRSQWAFATTSSFADRVNILRKNQFPVASFSVQQLINHGVFNGIGNCEGGDVVKVLQYAKEHGFVDETCFNYRGLHPDSEQYTDDLECMNCDPSKGCFAQKNFMGGYKRFHVEEFGQVKGTENIKSEIIQRGPVTCGIVATQELDNFRSNEIFEQDLGNQQFELNHLVSVIGWGVSQDGIQYWHVRNSWGKTWGHEGFFKIRIDKNNLGLGQQCHWATPGRVEQVGGQV